MDYVKKNKATIDQWIADGWQWGKPITHEQYATINSDNYALFVTPTKSVPHKWLGDLAGKKVLGLAAGGGQQGTILAKLGAEVTVMDFSDYQVASERQVADREGYDVTVVQSDMSQEFPFPAYSFDVVVFPVANVYVADVQVVWQEIARVLKPGGILISGLDNGLNYAFDNEQSQLVNKLPFNPLQNSDQMQMLAEDGAGVQFSHTIEEQIGGQIKAGFILQDVFGDTNGSGNLHNHNVPSFWATRAMLKHTGDSL